MITVHQAVKQFDGFRALDQVDLTVPNGAIYGLVGPNGAGKTTLLRHLTGVLRPDSGQVHIDGAPVYECMDTKSRIARMAGIPDEIYYHPQATIQDMMRYYRGLYPRFDIELYQKLGDAFNLDPRQAMRRLSKGMLKQAAFWLALCIRPDYLFLDEPVDGLDPVMRRQLWSLILDDAAQRGTTVLVSSHNLRELEDVCDHVGIMDRGKMLLERPLSELQENIVKVQLVSDRPLPPSLTVLHQSTVGRVQTLILRGNAQEISDRIAATLPIFYDLLPLSLEEIFIYELGGVDYAVKSIVL